MFPMIVATQVSVYVGIYVGDRGYVGEHMYPDEGWGLNLSHTNCS